ncbi:hypothetical protein PALB_1750 [Pseudoalteromonas luteoviolacea B = ATCC 29581]|nr:hypothetical protein PALB_1750 [Pseudoalteromonas luteoviolacea B = ATCC 29581]
MNRIGRYVSKEDVYLFFVAAFCMALVIWFQFIAYDWPEIFKQGQEASDLIVNISLSYIAGWIIYIISIFIPKINELKKKSALLKPILRSIVDDFEFNIYNSLLIPNQEANKPLFEKYKSKPLTIDNTDLTKLIDDVDIHVEQRVLLILNMRKQPVSNKEQITCICLEQKNKHTLKLEKVNHLLTLDALQVINEVENSNFIICASQEYDNFNSYFFSSSCFLRHYDAVVNLDRFIKEKI